MFSCDFDMLSHFATFMCFSQTVLCDFIKLCYAFMLVFINSLIFLCFHTNLTHFVTFISFFKQILLFFMFLCDFNKFCNVLYFHVILTTSFILLIFIVKFHRPCQILNSIYKNGAIFDVLHENYNIKEKGVITTFLEAPLVHCL